MSERRTEMNKTEEESESTPKLKRRAFLQAGALASLSLAVGPRQASAGANDAKVAQVPELPERRPCEPLLEMTQPDTPGICPAVSSKGMWPSDENFELVMAVMWGHFTRSAIAAGAKDVGSDAVLEGTRLVQQDVRTYLWLESFLPTSANWQKLEAIWKALGTKAAEKAGMRGCIGANDFAQAWNKPAKPFVHRRTRDNAAETIGAHMWVQFARGVVAANTGATYDHELVEIGREHSRRYIWTNVERDGVVSGENNPPNYAKWDFKNSGSCSYYCGKWAAGYAGTNQISEEDFHKAWCDVSAAVRKFYRHKGKTYRIRSTGCS